MLVMAFLAATTVGAAGDIPVGMEVAKKTTVIVPGASRGTFEVPDGVEATLEGVDGNSDGGPTALVVHRRGQAVEGGETLVAVLFDDGFGSSARFPDGGSPGVRTLSAGSYELVALGSGATMELTFSGGGLAESTTVELQADETAGMAVEPADELMGVGDTGVAQSYAGGTDVVSVDGVFLQVGLFRFGGPAEVRPTQCYYADGTPNEPVPYRVCRGFSFGSGHGFITPGSFAAGFIGAYLTDGSEQPVGAGLSFDAAGRRVERLEHVLFGFDLDVSA